MIGSAPTFWNACPSYKPPGCSDAYEAVVGDTLVFKYGTQANVWQLADEVAWEACSWAGATQLADERMGGTSSAEIFANAEAAAGLVDDTTGSIVNQFRAVATAPGVLHFAAGCSTGVDQREFCQDGHKIRVRVSSGQAPVCPTSLLPLSASHPSPQFELPSSPPSPPSPPSSHPPLPLPEAAVSFSGNTLHVNDIVLPAAIAVGSIPTVMAVLVYLVVLCRRRRTLGAVPSDQPVLELAVVRQTESFPVVAPDGNICLGTKTVV